jgi:predicted nucleic acid-binding Zn ribbon protein
MQAVIYCGNIFGNMTKLPEHGHCENCGDPIGFGEYFCSDKCSEEYEKDVKEAKRLDTQTYVIMGAGVVVAAVVAFMVKFFFL